MSLAARFQRRLILLTLGALALLSAGTVCAAEPDPGQALQTSGPEWVGPPVTPSSWDGDIRDLPPMKPWKPGDPVIEIPRRFYPDPSQALAHAPFWLDVECDPLVRKQSEFDAAMDRALAGPAAITAPIINIAGQGYTNLSPPDVAGDVGPNHYIQGINGASGSAVQIYDKAGNKIGNSFSMVSLGGTGSCTSTYGDPIILYDRPANRWFLLEFTNGGTGLCVHVSKTSDPVSGGWWNYTFDQATFPDYPHCAVWNDGYYCTANEGTPPIYVFDRANMLNGATARGQQTFRATSLAGYGFQALTPVHFMGATAAPAGTPFIAIRHNDDEAHAGAGADGTKDFLDMYSVQVNWTTPASSVFTTLPKINIAEFNSWFLDYGTFATVPQPGSTAKLDPIREVVLNRANYRNFGTYECIVGDFATNIDPARTGSVVDSGVRWFELRRTPPGSGSWTLYQEGTYGDGGNTKHHLEGSICMNKAGDLGMGFNVTQTSPTNIYASIKYTGRLSNDALGVMTQGESDIILGAAVETSGRWGDYPTMSVDPSDDCTFWMTHEYRPTGSWATRIATFKILPAAPAGPTFNSVYGTTLTVHWAAAAGGKTYDVYRAAGGACSGATKVNASPVTGLSYSDSGLAPDTQYSYYIVAVSECGSSANGACAAVTTLPSTPSLQYDASLNPGTTLVQICGDGDSVVEPGEQWQVTLRLKNVGGGDAHSSVATLAVNAGSAATATIAGNPGAFGTIPMGGGTATATFTFQVGSSVTCNSNLIFDLTGIASAENPSYPSQLSAFIVQVGGNVTGGNQAATQTTTPLTATAGSSSSNLSPAFTLSYADSASLAYTSSYTSKTPGNYTLFGPDDMSAYATNWTASGTVSTATATHCSVMNTSITRVGSSSGSVSSITLTNPVSTVGYTNVHVKFACALSSTTGTPQLKMDWFDGTSWTNAFTFTASTTWSCSNDITLPAGAAGKAGFKVRFTFTQTSTTTRYGYVDYVSVTGDAATGSWAANAQVELLNPASGATVLKAYGAADGSPYNAKPYYTGPGTYQIRVSENNGGTATLTGGTLAVNQTPVVHCTTSSCGSATPNPKEASPSGTPMTATRGTGSSVGLNFTPGCGATDHVVYRGTGPISGSPNWSGANCGIGATSPASFDPGTPAAGSFFYFVIVAQNGTREGSYGQDFVGGTHHERPEADNASWSCNRTQDLGGTCP